MEGAVCTQRRASRHNARLAYTGYRAVLGKIGVRAVQDVTGWLRLNAGGKTMLFLCHGPVRAIEPQFQAARRRSRLAGAGAPAAQGSSGWGGVEASAGSGQSCTAIAGEPG